MYDIALYGHLTFDTIIDGVNPFSYNIGGIANVWRALKEINDELSIYICPTNIGISSIVLNKKESERRSNSYLNQIDVLYKIQDAAISHISYLNEIDYPSFIQNLKGCVSADICLGRKIDISLFPEIKYLFVSEEDLELIKNLESFKGNLVIHGPEASSIRYTAGNYYRYHHYEYLTNVNVLGAGDYFAASYINNLLNQMENGTNMQFSHIATTNYLKARKEGK